MEVVYTSHMLEHLPRKEAELFLHEAHRVLKPEGLLRVAVPDLRKLVDSYLLSQDADTLIEKTLLALPPSQGGLSRLRLGLFGHRGHAWMYDERSLSACLQRAKFEDVRSVLPGETRLKNPEPLNLREREDESLYVEGTRV
jgi:hypothetical protein